MHERKWRTQTIDRQLKGGTAKSEINVKWKLRIVIEKASVSIQVNNNREKVISHVVTVEFLDY